MKALTSLAEFVPKACKRRADVLAADLRFDAMAGHERSPLRVSAGQHEAGKVLAKG
jgi:hypothetical protein